MRTRAGTSLGARARTRARFLGTHTHTRTRAFFRSARLRRRSRSSRRRHSTSSRPGRRLTTPTRPRSRRARSQSRAPGANPVLSSLFQERESDDRFLIRATDARPTSGARRGRRRALLRNLGEARTRRRVRRCAIRQLRVHQAARSQGHIAKLRRPRYHHCDCHGIMDKTTLWDFANLEIDLYILFYNNYLYTLTTAHWQAADEKLNSCLLRPLSQKAVPVLGPHRHSSPLEFAIINLQLTYPMSPTSLSSCPFISTAPPTSASSRSLSSSSPALFHLQVAPMYRITPRAS